MEMKVMYLANYFWPYLLATFIIGMIQGALLNSIYRDILDKKREAS